MSTQATTPDRLTKAVMNLPRRDARDKLQGRTRYTVDDTDAGLLHAYSQIIVMIAIGAQIPI